MRKTSIQKVLIALIMLGFITQSFAGAGMACQKQSVMTPMQEISDNLQNQMQNMDPSLHAQMNMPIDSNNTDSLIMDCCQDCECSNCGVLTALVDTLENVAVTAHFTWDKSHNITATSRTSLTLYRPPIIR